MKNKILLLLIYIVVLIIGCKEKPKEIGKITYNNNAFIDKDILEIIRRYKKENEIKDKNLALCVEMCPQSRYIRLMLVTVSENPLISLLGSGFSIKHSGSFMIDNETRCYIMGLENYITNLKIDSTKESKAKDKPRNKISWNLKYDLKDKKIVDFMWGQGGGI